MHHRGSRLYGRPVGARCFRFKALFISIFPE